MHTWAGDEAEWIRAEAVKLLAFEGLESVTVAELRSLRPHPTAPVADPATAVSFSRADSR